MSRLSTWLRQQFAWSNSQKAWQERLTVLGLASAALLLYLLAGRLSVAQLVLAWSVWLLMLAVVLRSGWLQLFGPVLFYDLVRTARRSRYLLLRCLYATVLALLMGWVYLIWTANSHEGVIRASLLARFAESFFYTFMVVQFLTVVVLTPAYTAGAIAEEKDRKTLEFLLATDLANREIVLSKLFARLANLFLLVLAGLPILGALQFLGGVDPNLVLAGFAATALTAASLGGLSILNSVWMKKPRDAIAITYLTGGAYIVTSLICWMLMIAPFGLSTWPSASSPVTLGDVIDWMSTGNIIIALIDLVRGVAGSRHLGETLPEVLGRYALFHLLAACAAAGWAVLRLRYLALREGQIKVKKKGTAAPAWRWRPRIGRRPMVWKELFAEPGFRFNMFGRIVVYVFVASTMLPAGLFVGVFLNDIFRLGISMFMWGSIGNPYEFLSEAMRYWSAIVGSMVGTLLLLGVATRASGCVSSERDRQTLDALYTSPMTSDDILAGKWLGCVLSVRYGWVWLGLVWGLGVLTGGLHVLTLPLLIGAWFVYAAFVACLGLWFSVVSRTSLRATLWTLLSTVGCACGHWLIWACCIPAFILGGDTPGQLFEDVTEWTRRVQVGLTPFLALGNYLPFRMQDFTGRYDRKEGYEIVLGAVGVLFWAILAGLLWLATSRRFRVISGRLPYHPARPPAPAAVRPLQEAPVTSTPS